MDDTLLGDLPAPGFSGGRTLVIAMSGWNDAGEAASTAVTVLSRQLELTRTVATFDGDAYYDYSSTRPRLVRDAAGKRSLEWPRTVIRAAATSQTDSAARILPNASRLFLLTGAEPSMHWRRYAREVVAACIEADISRIVVVGALLADAPHTRDIPVIMTTDDEATQDEFGIEASQYEGPTGIMSAITELAAAEGIISLSMWAQVPHYAVTPEAVSPTAVLALIQQLERVLQVELDGSSFAEAGEHWREQVSEAIAMDDELVQYVKFLEQARDTVDSDAASGDAIAAEFERFLADEQPGEESESSS